MWLTVLPKGSMIINIQNTGSWDSSFSNSADGS